MGDVWAFFIGSPKKPVAGFYITFGNKSTRMFDPMESVLQKSVGRAVSHEQLIVNFDQRSCCFQAVSHKEGAVQASISSFLPELGTSNLKPTQAKQLSGRTYGVWPNTVTRNIWNRGVAQKTRDLDISAQPRDAEFA